MKKLFISSVVAIVLFVSLILGLVNNVQSEHIEILEKYIKQSESNSDYWFSKYDSLANDHYKLKLYSLELMREAKK